MSRDKVTVDEPLISTDVDSLIRTIAEKKRVALNDLRQNSKIDKKTMDKWIAVLEDEGYITIEYGIRGTYVNWREIEEIPKEERTYRTEGSKDTQIHAEPAEATFSEVAKQAPPKIPDEPEPPAAEEAPAGGEDFSAEVPLVPEPEPEELLTQYLAKRRGASVEDDDSIKSNILTRLSGKEETAVKAAGGDEPEAPEEPPEVESGPVKEIVEEKPLEEEAAAVEEEPKPQEAPARPALRAAEKVPSADVRELMNSYVAEINKEKAKIESLRKDRESLYREKFATMEGKMQADIVVLTEKILEKQTKIAELKEHVLELPDKVEELTRLQEQMEGLRKESHEALRRTRDKADVFIATIEKSKGDVHGKIADIDTLIEAQSNRVRELEKVGLTIDQKAGKISSALEATKAEVDSLNATISALSGDLQDAEKAREEIVGLTEAVKQTVAGHGAELESLEQELEGISRVEHWVQEYVHDYEKKIDDIEQYVEKSDEELAELKEEAESLYMKKYLGELEDITEAYESELGDASAREQEIERKISESKGRITDLVGESQEMIKKLKGEIAENPQKDYGILVARVKAKTSRTKNALQEKEAERAKIIEDSRKTRKSAAKAPSRQPQRSAPKRYVKPVPSKKKRK